MDFVGYQSSQERCNILQGEYSDCKPEDKILTGKSKECKSPTKSGTSRFVGRGDSRSNATAGFLLHTKPSRVSSHYMHEEKQAREERPRSDPASPKMNDQSSLCGTLKRTENESEGMTNLIRLAASRKRSLKKSQNVSRQEGTSTKTPEVSGRSHTSKQLRCSEVNTKQGVSKMATRPKIGGRTRHQEESTFFDSATRQEKHKPRVGCSDLKKNEDVVNIRRNNSKENEDLEGISEGKVAKIALSPAALKEFEELEEFEALEKAFEDEEAKALKSLV